MRIVERSELDSKAALAAFFIFRLLFACGHLIASTRKEYSYEHTIRSKQAVGKSSW
jgi:hypothetical protein